MKPKSFRKFVEDKEASAPHLDALEDEMGIDPRDLEKEPMIGSFFAMGDEVRNIGPYKVLGFKRDSSGKITHAVVKRFDDRGIKNRRYRDEDGNMTRMKAPENQERLVIPVGELDGLLSQSLQPPPQTPGGPM